MKIRAPKIDKTAISPYDRYCDGYARPGAQGNGYVSVVKVATGTVSKTDDFLLDDIVARITSYNVCYTKLLRDKTAVGRRAAAATADRRWHHGGGQTGWRAGSTRLLPAAVGRRGLVASRRRRSWRCHSQNRSAFAAPLLIREQQGRHATGKWSG